MGPREEEEGERGGRWGGAVPRSNVQKQSTTFCWGTLEHPFCPLGPSNKVFVFPAYPPAGLTVELLSLKAVEVWKQTLECFKSESVYSLDWKRIHNGQSFCALSGGAASLLHRHGLIMATHAISQNPGPAPVTPTERDWRDSVIMP